MTILVDDTFDGTETMATHVPNVGGPWTIAVAEGYGAAATDLVVSGGNVVIASGAPSSPGYDMNVPQRPESGRAFDMEMDVKALNINHGGGPAYARLIIDSVYPANTFVQLTMIAVWNSLSGPPVIPAGVSVFWNVNDSLGNSQVMTSAQSVTANTFYNLRFAIAANRLSIAFYLNDVLIENVSLANPLSFDNILKWGVTLQDSFKDRLTLSRFGMESFGISEFWTDYVKTTETA